MKKLTLILLVALISMMNVGAFAQLSYPEAHIEGFYPECPVQGWGVDTEQRYTLPDFGEETHYWVRYWNASSHFLNSEADTGQLFPAVANQYDGIAYDGRFLYDPILTEDGAKVIFAIEEIKDYRFRYFNLNQVTKDPRLTNWWWAFCTDDYDSLFQAVEMSACTEKSPFTTDAIIQHMIQCGFVSRPYDKMTPEQITGAMLDYTNIAVAHLLKETQQIIGDAQIGKKKLGEIQPGQKIEFYNWYRYGPYPVPKKVIEIKRIDLEKGFLVFDDQYGGESLIKLEKIQQNPFIALRN